MSEEASRKRGRDDEPEGYDPRDEMDEEADALPPHMMGENEIVDNPEQDTVHYTGDAGVNRNAQESGFEHTRKRQRRVQLSVEIEKAYELCFELASLGDQKHGVASLLDHSTESMAFYWNEEEYSSSMMMYLGSVVVEMPHKNVLLSGLIMLGSIKNEKIGRDFTAWLKARVEEVFAAVSGNNLDEGGNEMSLEKCWNRVVLCLRMIALLSNLIEDPVSVIEVIKTLLQYAVDLQKDVPERVPVAELLINELLISLPYFLVNDRDNKELKQQLKECIQISRAFEVKPAINDDFQPVKDGEKCVAISETIKKLPDVVNAYLDDLRIFYDIRGLIDPMIQTVMTEKGKIAVKDADADEMKTEEAEVEADTDEKPVIEFSKHKIGSFYIPDFSCFDNDDVKGLKTFAAVADKLWSYPRYKLKVFSQEGSRKDLGLETLPEHDSYESIVLNDTIIHFTVNLAYNRVTVSRNLLNFSNYFNEKMFCKPNSSLDKLLIIKDINDKGSDMNLIEMLESNTELEENTKRDMIHSAKKIQYEYEQGYTSTWKMEEVVLETISDFIFMIPTYEEDLPLIYFESLVADTCGRDWTLVKKSQSNNNESLVFSKLVGDCFRYFYENVEKFEYVNVVKFVNWMLMQISNFKFEWEWQEWISDVIQIGEEKIFNPKIFFIKNVIHKEILVTNYKFIRDRTLPADFKKFVNISLKNRDDLIEFDSKFFGREFSEKFSNNPFEADLELDVAVGDDVDTEETVVETNTDLYKLFSHYLFNHDEHPFNDICRDIYMNLENVEESEDSLIELLSKLRERIANSEEKIVENNEEYIMTLIIESICLIGSRSFSVFEESLNKVFGDKLKKVIENVNCEDAAEKEKWIINAVMRIWNNEPRIGLLFVEKLSKYGLLRRSTIIESVFRIDEKKVLPLSEVYADEFVEKLIESEEGGEEAELVKKYMEECERVLATLEDVDVSNLDEQSSEDEWKKKNMQGLVKSKQQKYM